MGELNEMVYREAWKNRINDTRRLRKILTDLRRDGVPICSSPTKDGGGYYLAAAGSELEEFLTRIHRRALRALSMESRIRKTSLAEMLGQMSLHLREGLPDAAADPGKGR